MAIRSTHQLTRNFYHDVVVFDGYISLDSDASVVAPSNDSAGRPVAGTTFVDNATVAKNGTGTYEITLNSKFRRVRSIVAVMTFNGAPAAFDVVAKLDTVNLSTAANAQKLILVTRNSSAAAADVNAKCGIFFQARLEYR